MFLVPAFQLHTADDSDLPLPLCDKEEEAVRLEVDAHQVWCHRDLQHKLKDVCILILRLSLAAKDTVSFVFLTAQGSIPVQDGVFTELHVLHKGQ